MLAALHNKSSAAQKFSPTSIPPVKFLTAFGSDIDFNCTCACTTCRICYIPGNFCRIAKHNVYHYSRGGAVSTSDNQESGDEKKWYEKQCCPFQSKLLVPRTDKIQNKTGKQWHEPKKAFRPAAGLTSYAKRAKDRVTHALVKAKEKELKEEKEAERQVCDVMGSNRGWKSDKNTVN